MSAVGCRLSAVGRSVGLLQFMRLFAVRWLLFVGCSSVCLFDCQLFGIICLFARLSVLFSSANLSAVVCLFSFVSFPQIVRFKSFALVLQLLRSCRLNRAILSGSECACLVA